MFRFALNVVDTVVKQRAKKMKIAKLMDKVSKEKAKIDKKMFKGKKDKEKQEKIAIVSDVLGKKGPKKEKEALLAAAVLLELGGWSKLAKEARSLAKELKEV